MNYQLIQLSYHWYMVGDSVKNLGQICLGENINNNRIVDIYESASHDIGTGHELVIASTDKSLNLPLLNISQINKKVGIVDVDNKASKYSLSVFGITAFTTNKIENAYLSGYKDCLEDNNHKKFTEEDLIKFAKWYDDKLSEGREIEPIGCFLKEYLSNKKYFAEIEVEFIKEGGFSSAIITKPKLTSEGYINIINITTEK